MYVYMEKSCAYAMICLICFRGRLGTTESNNRHWNRQLVDSWERREEQTAVQLQESFACHLAVNEALSMN